MLIAYHLKNSFKLVNFFKPNDNKKVGIIELENISKELENKKILWKASQILQKLTKFRWIISISNKRGLKSLVEYEVELQKQEIESLKKDGLIKKILEIIPSSEVISIKKLNKKKNNRK